VADADPRLGMATACLRGLTADEALAGYTSNAAYAVGEETVAGRIRPGMRADLTGLPVDPMAPVWLTVVDGRVVHQSDVVDSVNATVLA
jgi:imidazolonepropionase-like amidohydrolase